jgi:aryl sulfotransferase
MGPVISYRSPDEDNSRWDGFEPRDGDIVVSARSKHGTTWVQMICTMLVLRSSQLPAPLAEISPWLDWLGQPKERVFERLADQQHRRVVKTHTPLDGLPLHPQVQYIVVARHPLDAAVSLYWQSQNIDRARVSHLTGQPQGRAVGRPLREWLRDWVEDDADPTSSLDSFPGVMHHVSDGWQRRQSVNVFLVHYYDLSIDLDRTMRDLAAYLGVTVSEPTWAEIVHAASFDQMRSRADRLAPDTLGILKSRASFFRRAALGEGWTLLGPVDQRRYLERVSTLASSELARWLNRPAPAVPNA